MDLFEQVMENDSDQEGAGSRNKRLKRTIEDTPKKQIEDAATPEHNEQMEYKSGSEEEYVPGVSKLQQRKSDEWKC